MLVLESSSGFDVADDKSPPNGDKFAPDRPGELIGDWPRCDDVDGCFSTPMILLAAATDMDAVGVTSFVEGGSVVVDFSGTKGIPPMNDTDKKRGD